MPISVLIPPLSLDHPVAHSSSSLQLSLLFALMYLVAPVACDGFRNWKAGRD